MNEEYRKPHLTLDEQAELLASRGMHLDRAEAVRGLSMIGYYRLSGYWYPYRRQVRDGRADDFEAGSSWAQVVALYDFDRRLRLLLLEALERIEIGMRARIGYTLGLRGAFAHLDPGNLDARFSQTDSANEESESRYAQWQARAEEAQSRSHENFVVHFESKYSGVLPVWVVTELLDFGGLSTLFQGLKGVDRNVIAEELGVRDTKGGNGRAVTNWMHAMTYLRNVCAHHSRLWNANMAVQLSPKHLRTVPALAHLDALDSVDLARAYPAVCLVGYLLRRIEPETSWVYRAVDLVQTLAATGRRPSEMGMPADWPSRLTAL